MQVRFTNSIASADWAYAPAQVVTLGKEFTATEIPADIGRAWLASGIVESVTPAAKPSDKPAPAKKGAK